MKWPPSEFWKATPYDCLLAAGGMAKMNAKQSGSLLTKDKIAELKELLAKDKLNNGKG
jgi:hypothetical protein